MGWRITLSDQADADLQAAVEFTDIISYEDIVKSILQHLFGLAFK